MGYHPPTRAAVPPNTDTLIYDGNCPFCTAVSRWLQSHARAPLALLSFAEVPAGQMLTGLDEQERVSAVHFVTTEGVEYHAGEAAITTLALLPGCSLLRLFNLPLLRYPRDLGYWLVAHSRSGLSLVIPPR